jgi:hypothetical protein
MADARMFRLMVDAEPLVVSPSTERLFLVAAFYPDVFGDGPGEWLTGSGATVSEAARQLGRMEGIRRKDRPSHVVGGEIYGTTLTNLFPVDAQTLRAEDTTAGYSFPELPDLLRLLVQLLVLAVDHFFPVPAKTPPTE